MLTTVTLHGALAAVAGRATWVLDVMSPGEAIRAIECQVGRVFRHLLEKDKEGVMYRVVCDGRDVAGERETLIARVKHYATIDFIPVPAGAGIGLWEAIAGVVLIAAGVVLIVFSEGTISPFAIPLIVAGIGLLAGGIVQMFFGPKPPVAAHQAKDRGDGRNVTSYLFNGPVNTVGQGGAVPLLYGLMTVGSQTISMSIRTASVSVGGDQPGSDAYRQEIYDAMNLGTIPDKTDRDNSDKG